jgi:hypothetical protein
MQRVPLQHDGAEYLNLVEVYRPGPDGAKPGSAAAAGKWEQCQPLSNGRSTLAGLSLPAGV